MKSPDNPFKTYWQLHSRTQNNATWNAYLVALRKGGKATDHAETRDAHDIGPVLGNVRLSDLNTDRLQSWLYNLANRPRHARGKGKGGKSKPIASVPPDAARKRKNSANRTWGVLRAALNHAGWKHDGKPVKPFQNVDAPKIRFLDNAEIEKLLAVIDGDFRNLVSAALHSGARFSELANLKVGDFTNAGIFIAKSKSGKSRHVALTDVAVDFFTSITKGKNADALLLTLNGNRWKLSNQTNRMPKACIKAGIKHAGFHVLRHSYASHAVMLGCPVVVVSKQLGHSGTAMTEKHYAHLSQNYVAQSIKQFGPTYTKPQ
ncbi:MAG TPA: site-specific integrase, partial [Methylocella sp.]